MKITNLRVRSIAFTTTLLWSAVMLYGEFFGGAPNSACYPYLGCDSGFFGYDAIEHLLFGLAMVWILVWLFQKFPQYSLLDTKFFKSGIILVICVTFIAVIWEMGELVRDAYLLDVMQQQLINFRLHINYLAQPSNFDTMGDLSFNLLGSILSIFWLRFILHKNNK